MPFLCYPMPPQRSHGHSCDRDRQRVICKYPASFEKYSMTFAKYSMSIFRNSCTMGNSKKRKGWKSSPFSNMYYGLKQVLASLW